MEINEDEKAVRLQVMLQKALEPIKEKLETIENEMKKCIEARKN